MLGIDPHRKIKLINFICETEKHLCPFAVWHTSFALAVRLQTLNKYHRLSATFYNQMYALVFHFALQDNTLLNQGQEYWDKNQCVWHN